MSGTPTPAAQDRLASTPRATSLALTAAWLVLGAVLFRYWDLTLRAEGILLWTGLFLAVYVLEVLWLRWSGGGEAKPWGAVWVWGVLWLGIMVGAALFPAIMLPTRAIQTVAFLRVFDLVLPLWILHRGVHTSWSGRVALGVTAVVPVYLLCVLWWGSVRMPSASHTGLLPALTVEEEAFAARAERHVRMLADSIGRRGSRYPDAVATAGAYLRGELEALGYAVEEQEYTVSGRIERNLEVGVIGVDHPEEIVIVGAHYDTYDLTPGADDNATGVAGVLELARAFRGTRPRRTIRFVLFGTEEPPHFNTDRMGSRAYAARSRQAGEEIVAMYSLEMLGYFDDRAGSQRHPPPMQLFFPDRGDFIAFVGNPGSGSLLRRSLAAFRESTAFPSEGVVSSSMIPGVELSDHASFWRYGYPALAISDTGPFRNVNYHRDGDTPDTIDYARMARVVSGIGYVIEAVAGS